jgi:hypothetical protein
MGERLYSMFDRLFGRPPIVFHSPQIEALLSATVFLSSNDPDLWNRARQPELAKIVSSNPPPFPLQLDRVPPPTTDDWPYLYQRSRTIPLAYLTVSLILLIMAVLLMRRTLEPAKPSTWEFFFLGAGFLLLETQLISRLALYFGATWWVNCVAISVLLLVLVLANLRVQRREVHRLGPLYAALLAFLMGIYLFPWQRLPFGTRAVGILLAAAYCLPVFCAGVIFTETFRRCKEKSSSFGSNVVGAVAGGLAQNISLIVGLKALLLLAALFYSLSGIFGLLEQRKLTGSEAADAATVPVQEPSDVM